MSGFTHFDAQGNAIMVDVTDKNITERCATASGCIRVSREVFDAVKDGTAKKGDVLGTARIAGIMAAKRTWELIPLCHPLMLTKVTIDFVMEEETCTIRCFCTAKLSGRTGVEMEALTGVNVALLTIYDMCKAMDRGMEMGEIHLEEKMGGKSGHFQRKKYNKKMTAVMTTILAAMLLAGCGSETKNAADTGAAVELTILAAASLTDVCNEIKTEYEAAHPNVTLHFSYGASGALQTQIEEGAPADLFFSAATKQMTALNDEGLMDPDSIVKLLENKVVLIVPEGSDKDITSFEDVATDKVGMIGLGEPGSVPVGQYSEEIFTSLGILDTVKTKANYGSDVRTVLSWVETGAVDCGVVYATDAYVGENIQIVCEAPAGSCKQVIYPVGIVKASEHADAAAEFLAYLQTDHAMQKFEGYGFSAAE